MKASKMKANTKVDRQVLKSYALRIGAVEKNFSRYAIEEINGRYKSAVADVRIKRDGKIDIKYKRRDKTKPEITQYIKSIEPTKEEQDSITLEVKLNPFPHSTDGTERTVLHKELLKVAADDLFRFYAKNDRSAVRMIQQRCELKNGERAYYPWSYWNDGEWRQMEPDRLPLFGLEQFKPTTRSLLIHEGAGCARFAQNIPDDHPWAPEIKGKWTANLGWIGGAFGFDRVDWKDIIEADKSIETIFFADFDQSGEEAIPYIAQILNRPMKVVRFDDRFPKAFDIKDSWPKKDKWWKDGKYIGPTLRDMLQPATWATDTHYQDKGPPTHSIRSHFAAEWFCVVTPEVFVRRDDVSIELNPIEFNHTVRSYSDVDNTARLVTQLDYPKVNGLKYLPAEKPGLITIEGQRYVNTHRPSKKIKAIKGDPAPFDEFMEHLIPDKSDRHELMRWVATLIARPEIKMLYGVLLISETQGVGKGTLGEKIIAPIVGEHNVSYPSEDEIVDSNFNYWLSHKRLAVVHEIYAGHSAKAYNKLKSVITDRYITVKKKFFPNYEIENWMHMFACSNSPRAIKLAAEDRRWFVPKVSEEKRKPEIWANFFDWIEKEDGLGIIKQWAFDFVEKHGAVKTGTDAPMTVAKADMIDDGRTDGEKFAFAIANQLAEFTDQKITTVFHVREAIKARRGLNNNNTLEADATVRQLLLSVKGLHLQDHEKGKQRPRHLVGGTLTYLVSNRPVAVDVRWKDLPGDKVWIPDANVM